MVTPTEVLSVLATTFTLVFTGSKLTISTSISITNRKLIAALIHSFKCFWGMQNDKKVSIQL